MNLGKQSFSRVSTVSSPSNGREHIINSHLSDITKEISDDESDEDLENAQSSMEHERFPREPRMRLFNLWSFTGVFLLTVTFSLFILVVYMVIHRSQEDIHDQKTNYSSIHLRDVVAKLPHDMQNMIDIKTDPCENFYKFSCGQWLETTVIPDDKSAVFASFTKVADQNREVLRSILNESWPYLFELYTSCMNTTHLNTLGSEPLKITLQRIAETTTKKQLFQLAGELGQSLSGFLTSVSVDAHVKDSSKYALYVSQPSLTLPDLDYYLKEKMFAEYEKDYRIFINKLFHLSSWTSIANNSAIHRSLQSKLPIDQTIITFEIQLAKIMTPKEELIDPVKTYNPISITEARKKYPLLVAAYLDGLNVHPKSNDEEIIIYTPSYFNALSSQLEDENLISMDVLRLYLAYSYLQSQAPNLSDDFVQTIFDFLYSKLSGQKERSPRWKVCVSRVTSYFPDLVGKYFVLMTNFNAAAEERATDLVHHLEKSLEEHIESEVDWLDEPTRKAAIKKLNKISNLIGHSKKAESFPFTLSTANYYDNLQILEQYKYNVTMDQLDKPVDRTEWYMSANQVNAYYTPSANQIVFPAGILQPPFFHPDYPAERNFGAIGSIVGHELTHGFDSIGRKFNEEGNLDNWWSLQTTNEFFKRGKCLVDQYSSFPVYRSELFNSSTKLLGYVNGNFTLSENIADNGGVKLAFRALENYISAKSTSAINFNVGIEQQKRLFFISFAQGFCAKQRDSAAQKSLVTDPHSPSEWRVNGVMKNNKAFASVFQCPANSRMNPDKKCQLW